MTNRQFSFSFTVGIAVTILGAVVLNTATIGLTLIALGAAISALAVLTRSAQGKRTGTSARQPALAPVQHSAIEH